MKNNFKIIVAIIIVSLVLNSCKKDAQWSSIDPNLEGGKWHSAYTGVMRGSTLEFYSGNDILLTDKGDGSSGEDDTSGGGNAMYENDVIIAGRFNRNKFKIEEFPVRFDTVIVNDVYLVPTKWRMKIRWTRTSSKNINWNDAQLYTFYRE